MDGILVVVPCGRRKIWHADQHAGPVAARDAYTSPRFRVNRAYAERFGQRWVILSAKYDFIDPDFPIPGPYDVTFNDPSTGPISSFTLREQVAERGLGRFSTVIGLGGPAYRAAIDLAFRETGAKIRHPFAGLPIGLEIQRVRATIATGQPFGEHHAAPWAGHAPLIAATLLASSAQDKSAPVYPNADTFRRELEILLGEARQQGHETLDVGAGALHRRVGGYPGKHHRMPVCCAAMRALMGPEDVIIQAPPSGLGATLTVRYRLLPPS